MNYFTPVLVAAAASGLLTSCFKDEAPNSECDIQQAFVEMEGWEEIFNNQSDMKVDIMSSDSIVSFDVKDGADVSKMAPRFKLTDGATISPESGTEMDFSGNTRHLYTVTSEDGAWHRNYYVDFGAKMLPTDYHFEQFDTLYEYDKTQGQNVMRYCQWIDYSRGSQTKQYRCWATGNAGFKLSMINARPDEYPTVPDPDGKSGYGVKLITRSTGMFGVMANRRIAAGNLFLGVFDVKPALTNTLATTRFGLPFDRKPVRLKGYYKYTPGETFQDKDGNAVKGKVDQGDIYAVFYRNHDNEGNALVLDGNNVKTSEQIIGMAELGNVENTREWKEFDIPFVYSTEPDSQTLNSNGYSIAIVCTSSNEGASFQGAVGSTLCVDELRLVCEGDE